MKKTRFFSAVAIAAMVMFVSNVWAGQQTYYFSPTMQGMFANTSTIYQAVAQGKIFTGPAASTLDSVVVEGEFGANCIIYDWVFEVLHNGNVIASAPFNNGKFKTKIKIPAGYAANLRYEFRFVVKRVNTSTNPCAASVHAGTGKATIYYTP